MRKDAVRQRSRECLFTAHAAAVCATLIGPSIGVIAPQRAFAQAVIADGITREVSGTITVSGTALQALNGGVINVLSGSEINAATGAEARGPATITITGSTINAGVGATAAGTGGATGGPATITITGSTINAGVVADTGGPSVIHITGSKINGTASFALITGTAVLPPGVPFGPGAGTIIVENSQMIASNTAAFAQMGGTIEIIGSTIQASGFSTFGGLFSNGLSGNSMIIVSNSTVTDTNPNFFRRSGN